MNLTKESGAAVSHLGEKRNFIQWQTGILISSKTFISSSFLKIIRLSIVRRRLVTASIVLILVRIIHFRSVLKFTIWSFKFFLEKLISLCFYKYLTLLLLLWSWLVGTKLGPGLGLSFGPGCCLLRPLGLVITALAAVPSCSSMVPDWVNGKRRSTAPPLFLLFRLLLPEFGACLIMASAAPSTGSVITATQHLILEPINYKSSSYGHHTKRYFANCPESD